MNWPAAAADDQWLDRMRRPSRTRAPPSIICTASRSPPTFRCWIGGAIVTDLSQAHGG